MELKEQLRILQEDEDILVCVKPAGLATQSANIRQKDLYGQVRTYLKSGYVGLVHRLDQPVEGILVLAKNEKAAAGLSAQLNSHKMQKIYCAVCDIGSLSSGVDLGTNGVDAPCGATVRSRDTITLTDFLLQDMKINSSKVVADGTKGAKKAVLDYQVLSVNEESKTAIVKIHLHTGRHHQIRVQMSHAGMPLLGDLKYGTQASKQKSEALAVTNVALCAYQLSFVHPRINQKMKFEIEPTAAVFAKKSGAYFVE